MRISTAFIFLCLFSPSTANAETAKFRPATKDQILKHVAGASELRQAKNGFGYKAGGSIGYKISHGKICVLAPRRSVDCVTVKTNGKDFQMIDRKGNREPF